MSELKLPITFRRLISDQRIEVPLIQRDYAQGREAQKNVRDDFLAALHAALIQPDKEPRPPLNLDFVYGSTELGDDTRFLPLDGQQRLTTLFLLHWYLAWIDNRLPEFKAMVWDEDGARFTYKIRPSSTEFFNDLVQFIPESSPDQEASVRRLVEDQDWFFLHWRSDPTIDAVLTMLDAIHERFRDSKDKGLYARLVDETHPAITFHLLLLEHFKPTDDLYIKMNARGKPLTTFETFKARFEELLKKFPNKPRKLGADELAVHAFFERRMDIQWTDFFWNHQRATFDEAAMNLVWAVIRVSLDPESEEFENDTKALGEKTLGAGFTLYHDRGWLTPRFADHLIDLLEAWSAGGGALTTQLPPSPVYLDEAAFFRLAISAPSSLKYLALVQFAALVFYLTRHRGAGQKDELREWMRVITNLASNSDIERPEEFGRSLAGLQKMVPNANRILEWLAETEIETVGFSPQQLREEVLKAKLILLGRNGWRKQINEAEAHGYFRGQIEFLFKFSGVLDRWQKDKSVAWSEPDDVEYQHKFSDYFARAAGVFSADGLRDFGECRWERALLMKGNYLLDQGINRSFLTNGEGDANWRRLLRGSFKSDPLAEQKRQHFCDLLDEIDVEKGVKESLDAVLAKPLPQEPWRCAMIERPEIIEYCWGRKVRWHGDGNIYLLRKIRTSAEHAELFTYHLKVGLLARKHQTGELVPFGEPQYLPVCGESDNPCISLEWNRGENAVVLKIFNEPNSFLLNLYQLPAHLQSEFVNQLGFQEDANGVLRRIVEKSHIESALDEIVNTARQPQPNTPMSNIDEPKKEPQNKDIATLENPTNT
jgi:hypothetical protein